MKVKRNLKDWVLPALALFVLIGSFFIFYLVNRVIEYSITDEDTLVTNSLVEETQEVNEEIEPQIQETSLPYAGEHVTISKYYYSKEDTIEKQQQSLIKYQNIYMPNTGILYHSDEPFDIVAIQDGKVTNIKEDEILGNIIEIEHENNLVTIYQSVTEITVAVGDNVSKGDYIAKSGSNKLEEEKEHCLHFEVYQNGNTINPEKILNNENN